MKINFFILVLETIPVFTTNSNELECKLQNSKRGKKGYYIEYASVNHLGLDVGLYSL